MVGQGEGEVDTSLPIILTMTPELVDPGYGGSGGGGGGHVLTYHSGYDT